MMIGFFYEANLGMTESETKPNINHLKKGNLYV